MPIRSTIPNQGRLYHEPKEALASGPHIPGAPTCWALYYLLELFYGAIHYRLKLLELGRYFSIFLLYRRRRQTTPRERKSPSRRNRLLPLYRNTKSAFQTCLPRPVARPLPNIINNFNFLSGSSSLKLADRGFKLEIRLWESFVINVVITLKSVF